MCQKEAQGPTGFYRPSSQSGADLQLDMMCYGRFWDPVTKYKNSYKSDGSEPPPIPYEFISLAENAIQDAQGHLDVLPLMCPDICLVNFYSACDRLGLHQVSFYINTHLLFVLAFDLYIYIIHAKN